MVYENGPNNLSAYVPDLPGCVGVGDSLAEVRETMKEAMAFHIELMIQHRESVPEPQTSLQRALDLHNDDLAEYYEVLGESLPEYPAIAELVTVDSSPEAMQVEYGYLAPNQSIPGSDNGLART